MRRLWPMIGKGWPANVTPVLSKSSPARMWAANQIDGTVGSRWGSLQSSGRPSAVRLGDPAQALLAPTELGSQAAAARYSWRSSAPAVGPASRAVSARMVGLLRG